MVMLVEVLTAKDVDETIEQWKDVLRILECLPNLDKNKQYSQVYWNLLKVL